MWYAQQACDYKEIDLVTMVNLLGSLSPIPRLCNCERLWPFYRPRLIADELGTLRRLTKRHDHAALFVAYRAARCQHPSEQSSRSRAEGAGESSPMAAGVPASFSPFAAWLRRAARKT